MLTALFRILACLPLRALHALGAALGWMAYLASPAYRRRMRENLQQAGLLEGPVLRRAIAESGKQALEIAWVWTRPGEQLMRRVQADNPEVEAAILGERRAVLFLTPHLGCFEIIAQHYMLREAGRARPMLALYRVPRKAALRPLFEQARIRNGLRLASADMRGVRLLIQALKQRQLVALLPDQVPSRGEGVWAPFFGRPAYRMTLPARLARAHDAVVGLFYAQRLPRGAGYRIRWERLEQPLTGDPVADATTINRAMELLIRRCPEQYLWSYARYKVPGGVAPPRGPVQGARPEAPA
ncbi:MAG TPA: lysophospholipid acyltransferase family protein [Burkholderiaceae bacterium]